MIERRLAVGEELAEDRQQAEVEAHFTAKRQRCRGSAGQTVGRPRKKQSAAVGNAQWAEAAHLFQPNFAPNLKMLSSRRRRAGHFDVGALSTRLHRSSVCSGDRGVNFPAEVGCQPVPQNSETCDSSHTALSGARSSHGWLRGRSNFRLPPLVAVALLVPRARCVFSASVSYRRSVPVCTR